MPDETHVFSEEQLARIRELTETIPVVPFRSGHGSFPPAMDFNVPEGVKHVVYSVPRGYGKSASIEEAFANFGRVWGEALREWQRLVTDAFGGVKELTEKMREAGVLPDVPPTDPKARALWAVQHRSTGPARPSGQNAHRPRRHH